MRASRRVILTRVPADNARLRAALGEVDAEVAEVIALPCLAIDRLPIAPAVRDRLLRRERAFDAAIFVSKPSVEHLLDALPEVPAPPQVVAIGGGTAAELTRRGWTVTMLPSEPRAEIAATELDSLFPGQGAVLHVRGDIGASLIQNALRERGREVVEAVVYRNRDADTPPLPPDERPTLLVATSPSVLGRGLKRVPDREALTVLAIGETTARAAREAGLSVRLAPEASTEGLAAGIREWLGDGQ